MAKGKAPPPHDSKPDYNPEAPARERLGDETPEVNEFQPPRNRSAPAVSVIVTVIAVLVLAALYFIFRG
ncbi:MAG: hypothetical protein WD314_00830 [Trueperaceae bacterium]